MGKLQLADDAGSLVRQTLQQLLDALDGVEQAQPPLYKVTQDLWQHAGSE